MSSPFYPNRNNIPHPDEESGVVQPVIVRQQWGALAPRGRRILKDTTSPTLHWNGPKVGLTADSSEEEEAKYLRGIQGFHMNKKGWDDIAYNFAFAPSGRVYELRGWKIRSAANGTKKGNDSSHAFLLMIGEGDDVTQKMIDSVRRMRALGDSKYVKLHRDWKSTACPGAEVAALVREGKFEGLPEGAQDIEPTAPNDVESETPVEKVPVRADTENIRMHLTHMRTRILETQEKLNSLVDYANVLEADIVDIEQHGR